MIRLRALIFHPLFVLSASLLAALAYSIALIRRFPSASAFDLLYYVVPIVVPFVAFLFDRAESFSERSIVTLATDALIVGISVARGFAPVPLVSGHALFLTYATFSADTRVAQVSAAIILLEVLYLKLFVWHDPLSLGSGIALAVIAARFVRWYEARINKKRSRKSAV